MPDLKDKREYLKMERFLQTLVKEIAVILEKYGFVLVEWRKERNRIKLIAEREGKKMELSFNVQAVSLCNDKMTKGHNEDQEGRKNEGTMKFSIA